MTIEVVVLTTFRDGKQMFITGERRKVGKLVYKRNERFFRRLDPAPTEMGAPGPSEVKETAKRAPKKRTRKAAKSAKK